MKFYSRANYDKVTEMLCLGLVRRVFSKLHSGCMHMQVLMAGGMVGDEAMETTEGVPDSRAYLGRPIR